MNVLAKRSRANVGTHTLATEFAMMSITMLDATGTKAIAVARTKLTKNRIVRNASAKIAKPKSKSAPKKLVSVSSPSGKVTKPVTMGTITARATGITAIAVARKTITSTVKNASVVTLTRRNAQKSAEPRNLWATGSATTKTTAAVAIGIKVTVVARAAYTTSITTARTASV